MVRRAARRFNWLAAGRRWRKTTLFMSIAVEAALQGQTIIWGAPVFDQVRIGWDETQHAARGVAVFNQTRMDALFPGGGRIIFRSLDNPDNARGHTADGAILDEVGDVTPMAWYEVIRPMLMDTHGWAWLGGTPKGRNWFFLEHARAADRADSMAWQAPTLGATIVDGALIRTPHPLENPTIAFSEIEQLFLSLPLTTFQQEILGLFLEEGGGVFRNISACLTAPETATPDQHAGHTLVMGVDWAQQADYTVLVVGCATCQQEVALDRFNRVEWALQRGRLSALAARWHVSAILAELNSIGSPNIEALQHDGLPILGFMTTAASKPPLIRALALALEQAAIRLLPDPVAAAELAAYESHISPTTGHVTYAAPLGLHDDCVMARALMWRAMQSGVTVEYTREDYPFG